MTEYIETTGKTEDAAIAAALEQLGLSRDQVSVEIITRPKTGFLGIGKVDAKVRVSYEATDRSAKKVEPPAPRKTDDYAEPMKVELSIPKKADEPALKKESKPAAPKAVKPAPKQEKKAVETKAEDNDKPAADRSGDIVAFLTGLMEHLEVEAKPEVSVNEDGVYEVVLEGDDLGALIGRRGETLDAIQQLTNYAVNHGSRSRVRVHVDCENYRAKREESLQRLARKTAGKAVKYRRNMMLEPMNAYERHVIHAELQEYHPNISTYSTGTEPNRRIVVAYNK